MPAKEPAKVTKAATKTAATKTAAVAKKEETFEEAVNEFLTRTRAMLGTESMEGVPPNPPSPYEQDGPPFESAFRFTPELIRRYAMGIGDDNPLYTDPEYGKHTKYGSQLMPGTALNYVRYGGLHGAPRPGGYPILNFIAGCAWEFYDVLRPDTRFKTSKVYRELIEKKGTQGDLFFLISEVNYWTYHGDLPARAYGTLIMVPQKVMGTGRTMDVTKLGEKMMYTRGAHTYSPEEIKKYMAMVEGTPRRGAEPRYWEDVEIGDKLGPYVLPPWSLQDQVSQNGINHLFVGGRDEGAKGPAHEELPEGEFELNYLRMRGSSGAGSNGGVTVGHVNPATMWPWTPGNEHEDALLAAYRGQPGPFDHGGQRFQIPSRLFSDWMGDDGFIRRQYSALRRPVYYADTTIYTGEVVKKFKEVQKGDTKPGGTPGEQTYYAVGIKWEGSNQVGQSQVPGTATVYLPSREGGPVVLPVPHPAKPEFVSYEKFRADWY